MTPGARAEAVNATEVTLELSAAMTVEEYESNADAVKGQLREQLGCHEPLCLLTVHVTAGSVTLTVVATDRAPDSKVHSAATSMGTKDVATLSTELGISLNQPPTVQPVRHFLARTPTRSRSRIRTPTPVSTPTRCAP